MNRAIIIREYREADEWLESFLNANGKSKNWSNAQLERYNELYNWYELKRADYEKLFTNNYVRQFIGEL